MTPVSLLVDAAVTVILQLPNARCRFKRLRAPADGNRYNTEDAFFGVTSDTVEQRWLVCSLRSELLFCPAAGVKENSRKGSAKLPARVLLTGKCWLELANR